MDRSLDKFVKLRYQYHSIMSCCLFIFLGFVAEFRNFDICTTIHLALCIVTSHIFDTI